MAVREPTHVAATMLASWNRGIWHSHSCIYLSIFNIVRVYVLNWRSKTILSKDCIAAKCYCAVTRRWKKYITHVFRSRVLTIHPIKLWFAFAQIFCYWYRCKIFSHWFNGSPSFSSKAQSWHERKEANFWGEWGNTEVLHKSHPRSERESLQF